jgi:aminoacrylate hydrolase
MPKVSIGDGEIYYESHGSGTPLLLVPGLGGTGNYWQPQIADFSKHFRVIIHDHREPVKVRGQKLCIRSTR